MIIQWYKIIVNELLKTCKYTVIIEFITLKDRIYLLKQELFELKKAKGQIKD